MPTESNASEAPEVLFKCDYLSNAASGCQSYPTRAGNYEGLERIQNMAEHEFESPRNRDDRSEKMPAHMLPGDSLPEHDCTEELAKTRSDAHHKLKSNAHGASASERRERRRAVISAPVRVRNVDATAGPDETTTTLDVSRKGLLVN